MQRGRNNIAKVTEKDICFWEALAEQIGRLYHHHRPSELKFRVGSFRRALPSTSELTGGLAEVPRHLRAQISSFMAVQLL